VLEVTRSFELPERMSNVHVLAGGRTLVGLGYHKTIEIDITDGRVLSARPVPLRRDQDRCGGPDYVGISFDGAFAIDARKGSVVRMDMLSGASKVLPIPDSYSVAISEEGDVVATYDHASAVRTINVYELASGRAPRKVTTPFESTVEVYFRRGNRYLYATGEGGDARLDLSSPSQNWVRFGATTDRFAAALDGSRILTLPMWGDTGWLDDFKVIDGRTGEKISHLSTAPSLSTAMPWKVGGALSEDGACGAIVEEDRIRIFDAATGADVAQAPLAVDGRVPAPDDPEVEFMDAGDALAIVRETTFVMMRLGASH
jgi:hypothetical protein